MRWTIQVYCGARLWVPIMPDGAPLHMPYDEWDDWKGHTFCGPGKIGDKLVPDKFPGGTVQTPCCYIHDQANALAETLSERRENDRYFMRNLVEAVFRHHPLDTKNKEHTDLLWAVSYYCAVDSCK